MQRITRPPVCAKWQRSGLVLASLAGVLLGAAAPVWAATINVANNTDYAFGTSPSNADGLGCTFRKALANASNGNGAFTACIAGSGTADTIAFADAADFQLGTAGIFGDITTDITITAPGAKKFLGGTGLGSGGIFRVIGSTAKLTMDGFTLQGATNAAVFLNNGATLSMNVGAFNNNSQDTGGGGAINGDGVILLNGIHFNGNSAPNGSGGAIRLNNSAYGASSITGSFFDNNSANNSGGAIYYSGSSASSPVATLTITNTLFGFVQANTAAAANGAPEVADTAIRELAEWPDTGAFGDLLDIAKNDKDTTHYVLTLSGYLRLLGSPSIKPTNDILPSFKKALELCRRPDEKKKVISGLQNVKTPEAAKMLEGLMDDEALREEACAATLIIAKDLAKGNKPKDVAESYQAAARAAFQKIIGTTKNEAMKKDAQTELDKMPKPKTAA